MSDQIVPGSTIREARFRLQAYSGLYQGNALGEAPVLVDHRKPYFSEVILAITVPIEYQCMCVNELISC